MKISDWALEIERSVFNWYCDNENPSFEKVFNSIKCGLENNVNMLVPINNQNDKSLSMEKVPISEKGEYAIHVFTSQREVKQKNMKKIIIKPLNELFDFVKNSEKCVGIIVNPENKRMMINKDFIKMVEKYTPKSKLFIVEGGVVHMHVGAIVNAANNSLLGGGGVDGAIHKAAGPGLLAACKKLNGCNTGEAKITESFNLETTDYIIHTVGPVYSKKENVASLLASCYKNSLDIALENGCKSIAFPSISTGVYGYPIEEASKISLLAVSEWFDEHIDVVINVYFCCFNSREFKAYSDLLK